MSKGKKRRELSRAKSRAIAPTKAPESKKDSKSASRPWLNEAIAIVYFALGAFLLFSFLAYENDKGSIDLFGRSDEGHLSHLTGPAGYLSGSLLSGFLGWSALIPVIWAIWMGIVYWNDEEAPRARPLSSRLLGFVGLFGIFVFSCLIVSSIFEPRYGGEIGKLLAVPLIKYINTTGTVIFASTLLVISLAVYLRKSVGQVFEGIGSLLVRSLKFMGITLPAWLVNFGDYALGIIASVFSFILKNTGLNWVIDELRGRREEPPIPSPRRHRNRVPLPEEDEDEDDAAYDEDDEDYEFEDEEEEDYSRVVVQRRGPERKLGEQAIKKVQKRAQEALQDFDPDEVWANYAPPPLSLISRGEPTVGNDDDESLRRMSMMIEAKLRDFSILGKVTHVHPGPVITLFEFEPAAGVKVGKIAALQDDLAMSLRASSIRILAPIPKRGTVGIEVPNKNREIVSLRDILESKAFVDAESTLSVPLGKDTYGDPVVVDISRMPHLLIAGATGTGKSVCINALLISMLYRASPAELGLIMIDPKILELSVYDGIPHLRVPVVTAPKQAKAVLEWAVHEMNRRYRLMQRYGVRSIDGFNAMARGEKDLKAARDAKAQEDSEMIEPLEEIPAPPPEDLSENQAAAAGIVEEVRPLPKLVIVIDELADLMLSVGREVEDLIARLAQKARAAGLHLIVATQRPSVDVVTGLIKANFPARISFRVTSRVDSRTILDSMGSEKLLGNGDMLFMSPGASALKRIHGAFVSDEEVMQVIKAVKENGEPHYDQQIIQACEKALEEEKTEGAGVEEDEYDALYDQCVELVMQKGKASTSLLQRAFRIGYNRAARIIDLMEREGVVGPADGARPRDVLAPGGSLAGNDE